MSGKIFSDSIDAKWTREKYIDPELRKRKWIKKYVKEEVNSVKSDFADKKLVFYVFNNPLNHIFQRISILQSNICLELLFLGSQSWY